MYLVTKRETTAAPKVGGIAGWLLECAAALSTGLRARGEGKRQLAVVETLSLGGRRQLHLVECAGERFLVGTGAESVETIVPVSAELEQPGGLRGLGEPR